MTTPVDILRGVLIQSMDNRLLLPNAAIAEVLSVASPDPVPGAPDWIKGRVRWRGWQLPLIAFSQMTGQAAEETPGLGSKVVVLKSIGGNARMPFFAVLTQSFPRLVSVARQTLEIEAPEDGAMPPYVHGRVRLGEDRAWIPHMASIESAIHSGLENAA